MAKESMYWTPKAVHTFGIGILFDRQARLLVGHKDDFYLSVRN